MCTFFIAGYVQALILDVCTLFVHALCACSMCTLYVHALILDHLNFCSTDVCVVSTLVLMVNVCRRSL